MKTLTAASSGVRPTATAMDFFSETIWIKPWVVCPLGPSLHNVFVFQSWKLNTCLALMVPNAESYKYLNILVKDCLTSNEFEIVA